MTIAEAYNAYIHILDKYGEAGITESEFSQHYNTAQMSFFLDFNYNQDKADARKEQTPPKGLEAVQQNLLLYNPFVQTVEISTDTNGEIAFSDVEANFPLDTVFSEQGILEVDRARVYKVMSIARKDSLDNYISVEWVPENNIHRRLQSTINFPDEECPVFRDIADPRGIRVYPIGISSCSLTVLRYPLHVWYQGVGSPQNVNPEWPNAAAHYILWRALALAGIQIREHEFYREANLETVKQ